MLTYVSNKIITSSKIICTRRWRLHNCSFFFKFIYYEVRNVNDECVPKSNKSSNDHTKLQDEVFHIQKSKKILLLFLRRKQKLGDVHYILNEKNTLRIELI